MNSKELKATKEYVQSGIQRLDNKYNNRFPTLGKNQSVENSNESSRIIHFKKNGDIQYEKEHSRNGTREGPPVVSPLYKFQDFAEGKSAHNFKKIKQDNINIKLAENSSNNLKLVQNRQG